MWFAVALGCQLLLNTVDVYFLSFKYDVSGLWGRERLSYTGVRIEIQTKYLDIDSVFFFFKSQILLLFDLGVHEYAALLLLLWPQANLFSWLQSAQVNNQGWFLFLSHVLETGIVSGWELEAETSVLDSWYPLTSTDRDILFLAFLIHRCEVWLCMRNKAQEWYSHWFTIAAGRWHVSLPSFRALDKEDFPLVIMVVVFAWEEV